MKSRLFVFLLLIHHVFCSKFAFDILTLNEEWGTPGPRAHHTLLLDSKNQKLYLFGGFMSQNRNDLWVYDLATGQWSLLSGDPAPSISISGQYNSSLGPTYPGGRLYQGMALDEKNGKIYLTAGYGADSLGKLGDLSDTWAFDINQSSWEFLCGQTTFGHYSNSKTDPDASSSSTLVMTGNGLWMLVGIGRNGRVDTWQFNSTTNSYLFIQSKSSPPISRILFSTAVAGNIIYLFSGYVYSAQNSLQNDVWQYNVVTGNWALLWKEGSTSCPSYGEKGVQKATNCPPKRAASSMIYTPQEHSLVIFGGSVGDFFQTTDFMNDIWKFSITQKMWTWLDGDDSVSAPEQVNYPAKRAGHAAVSLPNGNILLSGGRMRNGRYSSELWQIRLVDDVTSTFSPTPSLSSKPGNQNDSIDANTLAYATVIPCSLIFMLAIAIWWKTKQRKPMEPSLSKTLKERATSRPFLLTTEHTGDLLQTEEKTIAVHSALAIPGYAQYEGDVDYIFVRSLTEGGAGEIYLVELKNPQLRQETQGEIAVVKALKVKNKSPTLTEINAFNQEVALMNLFGRYPQFVHFLGYDPKYMGIIMRYYSAGSLHNYRKNEQTLWSKTIILGFSSDIGRGIAILHEKGFIHNDLKLPNILVEWSEQSQRPQAILADFGMVKSVDSRNRSVNALKKVVIAGATIPYAAPELLIALRERRDIAELGARAKAVDIYAFGLILYELVTLRSVWRS